MHRLPGFGFGRDHCLLRGGKTSGWLFACGLGAGLLALAIPATARLAADETPTATVRERKIVRKSLPKEVRSIALEYTIEQLTPEGGTRAIDPAAHTFQVGDSFLVRISPEDDLYVYVFNEGPDGERICLMPTEGEEPQLVKSGTKVNLPDDGGFFTFEPPAGEEKLVVVALPEPTKDLRLLAAAVFRGQGGGVPSVKAEAKTEADAALKSMRDRAEQGTRSRGPVRKVVERMSQPLPPDSRTTHIEPPSAGETASYGIAIAGPQAGPPELILDIPLRSSVGK